jgi:hypothetical protein
MTQLQDKFGAFEIHDSPRGQPKWRAVMSIPVFFENAIAGGQNRKVECFRLGNK